MLFRIKYMYRFSIKTFNLYLNFETFQIRLVFSRKNNLNNGSAIANMFFDHLELFDADGKLIWFY